LLLLVDFYSAVRFVHLTLLSHFNHCLHELVLKPGCVAVSGGDLLFDQAGLAEGVGEPGHEPSRSRDIFALLGGAHRPERDGEGLAQDFDLGHRGRAGRAVFVRDRRDRSHSLKAHMFFPPLRG
jgi:hypothetical protein